MPFVSQKDNKGFNRKYDSEITPYPDPLDPTFGETIGAAFGSVIDEELSISSELNQNFRVERQKRTAELIRQGVIQREKYQDQSGIFDYNRLHRDLRGTDYDGLIDADYQVREKRNEMLRKRREGRDAILAEGSGMAQFLGMGAGYMLDPINMMTMPIGTVAAAHKGLTVTATALNAAKSTAALSAASELAIQPFVFAHKEDIESPYSFLDSIAAIGFAAGGGAALGAVAGGLTGYFRKVKDRSNLAILGVSRSKDGSININTLPEAEEASKSGRELAIKIIDAEEKSATGKISDREAVQIIKDHYNPITGLPENLQKAILFAQQQKGIFKTSDLQKHLRIGYNPTREIIEDLKARNLFAEDDSLNIILTKEGRALEADMIGRAFDDVADYVEQANSTKPKTPAKLVDDQNVEVLETKKPYEKARDDAIEALNKERSKLEKSERWTKIIKGFGGLNKAAWKAEGIDEAAWTGVKKKVRSKKDPSKIVTRTVPPAGFPPGFWRAGDEGLTPEGLIRILRDRQDLGVIYEKFDEVTQATTDDVMPLVESIIENPYRYVDDVVETQLDDIDMRIAELEDASDEALEAIFRKNSEEVMEQDIQLLREFEEGRLSAAEPARTSDDFPPPDDLDAPSASVTNRERELLNDAGYAESLDEAMAQYEALAAEKKIYIIDGDDVDFDELIKGYDEQLEISDALRRCVYGE